MTTGMGVSMGTPTLPSETGDRDVASEGLVCSVGGRVEDGLTSDISSKKKCNTCAPVICLVRKFVQLSS